MDFEWIRIKIVFKKEGSVPHQIFVLKGGYEYSFVVL